MLAYLLSQILSLVIGAVVSGLILYVIAKRMNPDEVTLVKAFFCSIWITLTWAGSLLVAFAILFIPMMFLGFLFGPLVLIPLYAVAIYFFFKWAPGVIRNSFDMGGGANTVLVLYLLALLGLNLLGGYLSEGNVQDLMVRRGGGSSVQYVTVDDEMDEEETAEPSLASMGMATPVPVAAAEPINQPVDESLLSAGVDPQAIQQMTPEERAVMAEQMLARARKFWDAGQPANALQAAQRALTVYRSYLPENDAKVLQTQQMIAAAQQAVSALPAPTPAAQ